MKKDLRCRIIYKETPEECYELEISTDNGKTWGLCRNCRFFRCAEHPEAGANFISYTLLTELDKCLSLGYKYDGIITG